MSHAPARVAVGCCISVLVGIGAAWALGVRINTSPSMPRGVWWIAPASEVRRGDAVAVCAPSAAANLGRERGYLGAGGCGDGSAPLLKVAAAVAGDMVAVAANGLAVNGAVLADTAPVPHDAAGRELRVWPPGVYTVQSGSLWVTTPRANSWDSRYWGPVPAGAVRGEAWPLLVLP